MKKELKLENPILINGKSVNKLSYDETEITAQMFAEADGKKMLGSGSKNGNLSGAVEIDYALHLYLGFAAIIAVNPEYDYKDLERIHGFDVMKVMGIGRNFIIGRSEEPSNRNNLEAHSDTIPEPSLQVSKK